MSAYELIHLGGENGVTGSCHLFLVKGLKILVDCDLAQGDDRVMSMSEWPVGANVGGNARKVPCERGGCQT